MKKKIINILIKIVSIIVILVCNMCVLNISTSYLYACIHIIDSYFTSEGDELYVKMHEIDINNGLYGLSKEEVVQQLGKPISIYEYDNGNESYRYNAGHIYEDLLFGHRNFWTMKHSYILDVKFNEDNRVISTIQKEST